MNKFLVKNYDGALFKVNNKVIEAEFTLQIQGNITDTWYPDDGKPGATENIAGGNYRIYYVCGAITEIYNTPPVISAWNRKRNYLESGVGGTPIPWYGMCGLEDAGSNAVELPNFSTSSWNDPEDAENANKGLYVDATLAAGNMTFGYVTPFSASQRMNMYPPGIKYAFCKL